MWFHRGIQGCQLVRVEIIDLNIYHGFYSQMPGHDHPIHVVESVLIVIICSRWYWDVSQ